MTVPARYREIVGQHVGIAAGIGVPGAFAFGADVPFLLGSWAGGAIRIFNESGFEVEEHEIKSLAGGVLAGVGSYIAGASLATKLFHLVPGPGTVAAVASNVGLNGFFTYRFLRNLSKLCDKHDNEELIWQTVSNVLTFITPFGILDDVKDMLAVAYEAGDDLLS